MGDPTYLSNWVTNYLCVRPNTPVNYEGRPWMPAIFDTNERFKMLKTSRQVGKSTAGCGLATAHMAMKPYFNVLYVAPVRDQARKFSYQKVTPMIEGSPLLQRRMGGIDNVHEKKFNNGSKYFLLYAKHNPDSARGPTADFVHYDEVQDQDIFEISPVIDEALTNSEYKFRLYSGTPKSFSNPSHYLWQDTDQREWIINCEGCSRGINVGVRNIGKKGPVCHHCGKLLDISNGQWVKHNPGAKIAGFHVNQLHLGVMTRSQEDWDEMLHKFETYEDWRFLNEVMGMAADTADVPITEAMIRNCCDPSVVIDPKPLADYMGTPLYAGIDWGHGDAATVISIGQFHEGKFRYLFIKKFEGQATDPKYCVPKIVKILKDWRVKRVHCDYGGGFGLNERIRDEFGRRKTTTNYWSGSAQAADRRWSEKHNPPRLTMNKSKAFGTYIRLMRRRSLKFPCSEDMFDRTGKDQSIADDFLNIRQEIDSHDRVTYIKAGPEQHDDAVHACIYAYIIARQDRASRLSDMAA